MSISKEVKKEYDKLYRLKNLDKRRAQQREWNKDIHNKKHKKEYDIKYREQNREKINAKHLKRKKTNPEFKLRLLLRNRLGMAIKNKYKKGSAVKDLGCSIEFFKIYIENKFEPGMNWNNWSRSGWHLDHIIPLAYFNLQDRSQFLKATHYTNLRPLWAIENCKKGAKLISGDLVCR